MARWVAADQNKNLKGTSPPPRLIGWGVEFAVSKITNIRHRVYGRFGVHFKCLLIPKFLDISYLSSYCYVLIIFYDVFVL